MLRSIGAIVVGYVIMAVLVMAGFAILQGVSPESFPTQESFPPTKVALVIVGFGLVAAVTGGYVAAWIAKHKEMQHGMILAAVALVLGIVGILVSPVAQPMWYQAALLGTALVGPVVGACARSGGGRTRVN